MSRKNDEMKIERFFPNGLPLIKNNSRGAANRGKRKEAERKVED
jgi:hypothetical protein